MVHQVQNDTNKIKRPVFALRHFLYMSSSNIHIYILHDKYAFRCYHLFKVMICSFKKGRKIRQMQT